MKDQDKKWEVIGKIKSKGEKARVEQIVDALLLNRGIPLNNKKDFFNPKKTDKFSAQDFGIDKKDLEKAKKRIKEALNNKEKIIVYGDYDTDGVCATAIMWETLFGLDADVMPHIPNRFEEGYGINPHSVKKLKSEYTDLKLIITVDNGIVANAAIDEANNLGIDVIITDHHQKEKSVPNAFAIVHTDKTSGSGISWFLAKELSDNFNYNGKLELAAVGTIADQIPMTGINRSMAKFGLEKLGNSKRPGMIEMFKESGLYKNKLNAEIGTYEVNYIIAPRLNAMGRLEHAIDSLRLVCTKSVKKAKDLAIHLSFTNQKRQKIVAKVLTHAKELASKKDWTGAIVLSDKSYHEGVIGLAAGKLVEEFGRPALVISEGKKYSKGSARSISGLNIIKAIHDADDLLEGAGGHPMAAGFKLKTDNLKKFAQKIEKITAPMLTPEILQKKLKIDLEIVFTDISSDLYKSIKLFEPTGIGNFSPSFLTKKVRVLEARTVGNDNKHLKIKLEKDGKQIDAIGFGLGHYISRLETGNLIDVAYSIDENVWNGYRNLQLKLKDIHFS